MGSSVSCILRIYPPNRATQPVEVYAANIRIEAQAQYPAVLTASFIPDDKDWELFKDETSPVTPVQTRAVVEYIENDRRLFFGSLWSVRRDFALRVVTITAFDKLQVLNETYAIYDDGTELHYNFANTSPLLAITRVEMIAGHDYGYGFRNVWFPIFSDTDAWLTVANSPATTLGQNIASGISPANGSRIKMGQTHSGLLPAGFVTIDAAGDNEWIQYNGYAYDQTDGFWYIHDIQRGALGSTAAAHTSGATVHGRILKRIFFRGPLRMEGYTGTAYEILKREQYKVNYEEGHFAFSSNPLELRTGSDYTSIFGTYPVYDEEGGGAVDLADWIEALLVTDPDAGGPGFDAAYTDTCTPDISFANPLTVTRIQIDKPTFVLDAIRDVASQLGLAKGTDQDALIWYYESHGDKATFKTVAQGNPDRLYTDESRIDEEVNLENPKSAILVRYESGADFNLIGARRIWHPEGEADLSASFPQVRQLAGGAWGRAVTLYPHASNATYEAISGGPAGTTQLLLDNDATTGWGLFYDADPGAGVYLYGWFPGVDDVTPDLYWLDTVSITLDVSGYTVDPAYFSVTVFYYDTFTGSSSTTPPTPGTAKPISERMTLEYTPGALNNPTVTITAGPDLFIQARAIGIRVDGFMKDVDNDDLYCIKIKDIYAAGKMVNHELVKLVASYTNGSFNELVAPLSTAKLRNALMGQHVCDLLDVGPATREVALNLAWLYLLQSLIMSQIREYYIQTERGLWAGVPIISETLQMSDGFEGVCDYFSYENIGGNRSLTVRLINYRTEVLGS